MADYSLPKAVDFNDLSAKRQGEVTYAGRIIQPKWDGCAIVVNVDVDGEASAVSASGKPVKSCDHLVATLLAQRRGCGERDYGFRAAGEVWVPNTEFQHISGAFRRHQPQPHLQVHWFDFVEDGLEHMPYVERTGWFDRCRANFAGHALCLGRDHAWENASYWKKLGGYDGAILRDPLAPWATGRSKGDVLKLKPVISHDLLVVDVDFAVGEKTGKTTAALVCRWRDGRFQKVATGMTQAQVDGASQFVGKIVEVEAMGYTSDGFLREPRFKGERIDKTGPDF